MCNFDHVESGKGLEGREEVRGAGRPQLDAIVSGQLSENHPRTCKKVLPEAPLFWF